MAFSSFRSGGGDLYVTSLDGSRLDRLLLSDESRNDPTDWSRDGRFLLFERVEPAASSDRWYLLRMEDGRAVPFLQSTANEWGARFSPNGKWVAFTSDESGRHEIHVRAFPGGDGALRVSHQGARHPMWRGDGSELYYLAANDTLVAVPIVERRRSLVPGSPAPLFSVRPVRYRSRNFFAVSNDGKRFLINERIETLAEREIKVIVNWVSQIQ